MDIHFTVMPFAELDQPSLGVGLLHALARERGFSSGVRYFTFPLAERIGADFYRLSHRCFGSTLLAGDWLFAEALFGADAPPAEGFVREALSRHRGLDDPEADLRLFDGRRFVRHLEESVIPRMLAARGECTALADEAAAEILAASPRVAAFTAGSQQLCAALAVARRLKQAPDPPVVLFGGPSCFGEMGLQLLRSFPWVDYVCTGEGDRAVPDFLDRMRQGRRDPPAGILAQGAPRLILPPPTTELSGLPAPDFHDYFRQLEASPLRGELADRVLLPLETSRGCWWGEKSQCSFCGNHPAMQIFRSKTASRVTEEMEQLVRTYRPRRLALSDDILDPGYFGTLFPLLACGGERAPFFCESKVNLSRLQVKRLRDAGCDMVQFGIESLSNRLLALMRKGCASSHAVQSLRWALELGMDPCWNLLYGVPGELPEDYGRMAARLPLLAHLPPPMGCVRIAVKRFSPYHAAPKDFGFDSLRPAEAYGHIFPLPPEELQGLAYYFETGGETDPPQHVTEVRRLVGRWIAQWTGPAACRPRLELYRTGRSEFLVIDTRPCAVRPAHRLGGIPAEVYTRCDSARTVPGLVGEMGGAAGEKEIRDALDELAAAGLLWREGERFLALALFRNRHDDRTEGAG